MHCFFRKFPFPYIQRFNQQLIRLKNPVDNIQLCEQLHGTSCFSAKMYLEYENKYAYKIMESQGYAQKLFDINDTERTSKLSAEEFDSLIKNNWNDSDPQELIDTYGKLGDYVISRGLCISDRMFDNFVDKFSDRLSHASDEQLFLVFDYMLKWPDTESIRTRNFIELWTALDDVCCQRLPLWSDDQILLCMAKFYQINVMKQSDFARKALNRLASKSHRLNSSQIVKTMFFIGIQRMAPHDIHKLEVQLENYMNELTVEELSIVAMGFFKSKKPIRNMEIITKIIDKIIESSKTVHEVSLAALLKVIRYSIIITYDEKVEKLLAVLKDEVPRLSVMCCVHLALLGTATVTLHKECLDEIAKYTYKNLDKTRTKDLERLVFSFGSFNHRPKIPADYFEQVLYQLRRPEREKEIQKYGQSFISCLSFLGVFDYHPKDLINKALDPVYLENSFGKNVYNYNREVLTLHNRVMIYFPDSDINRLSEKTAKLLAKKYTDYFPDESKKTSLNFAEKVVVDVTSTLRRVRGGPGYVIGEHVLTSYQRGDIIICNDKSGNPVPVSNFDRKLFGSVIRPPDDNEWIVLIIAARNAVIKKHGTVIGSFQTKARELRALGYKVGMVKWNEWSPLVDTTEKINYLQNVIENAN